MKINLQEVDKLEILTLQDWWSFQDVPIRG